MSCSKSEDPTLPRITHLEVGSADNGSANVGSDLHVDMEIEAGDRIDLVDIKITQRPSETYTHAWEYQVIWDGHRGARNAHIHEHIDIPGDAALGTYDFLVTITDQNGTTVVVRRDLVLERTGE